MRFEDNNIANRIWLGHILFANQTIMVASSSYIRVSAQEVRNQDTIILTDSCA